MALVTALLPILGGIGKQVAKSLFPDPQDELKRQKAENQITNTILKNQAKINEVAASVVMSETKGDAWLQKNWRPITMMTFVGLIVAKWLGFTAPGVTEAIELELLAIIKVGLGGYVLGRSAEKGIKEWKK